MLKRIFGREKNDPNDAACASCGRTLLAGEWTQTTVDEKGRELRVCSLCAKPGLSPQREDAPEPTVDDTRRPPQPADPAESARSKSDAFWRALKDKNAEIEWYQAQLARLEAERQEMLGRLSQISATAEDTRHEDPAEPAVELKPAPDEDEAAVEDTLANAGVSAAAVDSEATAVSQEDTQPIPVVSGEEAIDSGAAVPAPQESVGPEFAAPAPEESVGPELAAPEPHEDAADDAADVAAQLTAAETEAEVRAQAEARAQADAQAQADARAQAEADARAQADADARARAEAQAQAEADARAQAEAEAEAASLTLLQRGVDLLNVSTVPRKIAETNEQLGMPTVHVAYDGQILAATFMWSIGWYRFHVDTDSGQVSMDDRGYDELSSLLPNASVRTDGTVQLAAGQLSRPSAPPHAQDEPATPQPSEPEPPSITSQKAPEILSKSLLGQRSDDAPASWEQTQARDFNWDR